MCLNKSATISERLEKQNVCLSQEELAFLINSARNYIGCIERAEKFASVTMLKKIADALDLKLADLFKECD